jgi:hypothetical protein
MVSAVKSGDCIVVYSLNRATRSIKDAINSVEELDRLGVSLVSSREPIDLTTATGRLNFNIFASFAQFQREQVSEVTRAALKYRRDHFLPAGVDIYFGWKKVGKKPKLRYVPDAEQRQQLIRDLITFETSEQPAKDVSDAMRGSSKKQFVAAYCMARLGFPLGINISDAYELFLTNLRNGTLVTPDTIPDAERKPVAIKMPDGSYLTCVDAARHICSYANRLRSDADFNQPALSTLPYTPPTKPKTARELMKTVGDKRRSGGGGGGISTPVVFDLLRKRVAMFKKLRNSKT